MKPAAVAAASASLLLALGASPIAAQESSAPASPAAPTGLKAIYVSSEPIGVNPFLQLIAQGLTEAGTECGVETKVVESQDPASMADNFAAAVDEGWDLIVANSFESADAVKALADANPDQKWAIVDTIVDSPNVRGLVFKEHEGTYLLGATIGLLATGNYEGFPKSEVIGEVGAVDLPFIRRWSVGFEEGARKVNPDIRFDLGWATGFNDPVTSNQLAVAQHGNGAEYVFAFSAAGNDGIFQAAKENNFFTTGVDTDQRSKDPDHILESMVKRTDVGVHKTVCDLAHGAFTPGIQAFGLAENGVGPAFIAVPDSPPASRIPAEVQEQVKALAEQIKSGEIVVTDYLAQPPASPAPGESAPASPGS
jgi:basic membrane protein A